MIVEKTIWKPAEMTTIYKLGKQGIDVSPLDLIARDKEGVKIIIVNAEYGGIDLITMVENMKEGVLYLNYHSYEIPAIGGDAVAVWFNPEFYYRYQYISTGAHTNFFVVKFSANISGEFEKFLDYLNGYGIKQTGDWTYIFGADKEIHTHTWAKEFYYSNIKPMFEKYNISSMWIDNLGNYIYPDYYIDENLLFMDVLTGEI